jgi:carbon catabolite-derepressing protein kinase
MLVVDPVRRLTVHQITEHPFYTEDLPRYLTPLPPRPGPVLPTLSSLVVTPTLLNFEIIEGLGPIEEDIVDELVCRIEDVTKNDIWNALRRDDGVHGNAVKVAYMLLRDKRRSGEDLSVFEEQEREAQLAAMDVSQHSYGVTSISNTLSATERDVALGTVTWGQRRRR